MAEKDNVFSGKVKHSGIFDFKDFYAFAYDWLNSQGYDVSENVYAEEIAGDSKNIKVDWTAKRKISDYFRFVISVSWQVLGLKSIEVTREGKKIKTNQGTIEIKIKGVLVKDYENRWEDHPFWKFLRGVYERYIIRSRIDEYEDKLGGESEELVAEMKSYLALEGKR